MVCGDATQPMGVAKTAHHPGVAVPQKGWDKEMALYLDIHHHVDGLTADAVKGAHAADVATQEEFGVRYLEYWFNEGTGQVFCLVEAPSAEAAAEVHRRAHGLVADEIIEVRQGSAS
jgi:hypothetical protein